MSLSEFEDRKKLLAFTWQKQLDAREAGLKATMDNEAEGIRKTQIKRAKEGKPPFRGIPVGQDAYSFQKHFDGSLGIRNLVGRIGLLKSQIYSLRFAKTMSSLDEIESRGKTSSGGDARSAQLGQFSSARGRSKKINLLSNFTPVDLPPERIVTAETLKAAQQGFTPTPLTTDLSPEHESFRGQTIPTQKYYTWTKFNVQRIETRPGLVFPKVQNFAQYDLTDQQVELLLNQGFTVIKADKLLHEIPIAQGINKLNDIARRNVGIGGIAQIV